MRTLSYYVNKMFARTWKFAIPTAFEPLEQRLLFTSVVVNTTADRIDSAGSSTVSLRDAIAVANRSATPTSITFDPKVFAKPRTIVLMISYLELRSKKPVAIAGPSAGVTFSDNIDNLTSEGVLLIDAGVSASLYGISIGDSYTSSLNASAIDNSGSIALTNCTISGGGGGQLGGNSSIANERGGFMILSRVNLIAGSQNGSGLSNGGTLKMSNVTISGSSEGGVSNYGTATLTQVTISGNDAGGIGSKGGIWLNSGGGIVNGGYMTLSDSTIANNRSEHAGGGIENDGGTLNIENCTIVGNHATIAQEGAFGSQGPTPGTGGGINVLGGTVTLANTVVAGNESQGRGPDVYGTVHSSGFNLVGKTNGSKGWTSKDLTGTLTKPLSAQLTPLGKFGGFTQTMVPLPGSPVLNRGSNALVPKGLSTDQRGLARVVNGVVDIGAVEAQNRVKVAVSPAQVSAGLSRIALTFGDAKGNVVTNDGASVTIRVATGPVGAKLTGSTIIAAKAGVTSFRQLLTKVPGTYVLKAPDAKLPSILSVINTATAIPALLTAFEN